MTEPSPDQFTEQPMANEERPPIGPLGRLLGVIMSPSETFADINRAPTWLVALLFLIFLTVGFDYLLRARVPDYDQRYAEMTTRLYLETLEKQGYPRPPDAELERQRASQQQLSKFRPLAWVAILPVKMLIISGMIFLVLLMTQADTSFKKTFATVIWSDAATSVVYFLVSAVVLMMRDPTLLNPMSPGSIVATNVATIFSVKQENLALYTIAASLDVFKIWFLVVLTIGLSSISKRVSRTKAGVIVGILWGFWVCLMAVLAMVVGSRIGIGS